MKMYIVSSVVSPEMFDAKLSTLPAAEISHFPWDTAHHYRAYAILAASRNDLHVFMRSEEEEIRAVQTEQNGPIYTDSCLELYLMPTPHSNLYLNIEVNPHGVIFFSVGQERNGRLLIAEEGPTELSMKTEIHPAQYGGAGWYIRYDLPFDLIRKYIPMFDPVVPLDMRGNFYKCGNGLSQPHWGMWSPVETPKPDFHRPEYFGRIVQK